MAIAALAVMLIACDAPNSSDASSSGQACPPPPAPAPSPAASAPPPAAGEPAPEQILVCAGSEAITGASYSHWATIARRSEGRHPNASQTRSEVLGFLISSDWVIGEARDLQIGVSAAQVKRQFDRVKAQQFPRNAGFRAFLRSSGETVADLLFRVRLNMLSERLQRHVAGVPGGPAAQQRALARFVEAFHAKWSSQTYCATGYVVQDCGHAQSVL
jgi:hypothetical protein